MGPCPPSPARTVDRRVPTAGGRPGRARAVPPRADRLLLPHARLRLRGRGRRAGDDGAGVEGPRPLRGPVVAAVVAVPHRHQRLPRHAAGAAAPGPADGPRPGVDGRRRCSATGLATRSWIQPDRRRQGRAASDGDPGRGGRRPGDHPPGVRRRPAAPAAAPAGRADPARGAALARRRGRRAARHQRSRRSTARCSGPGRRSARSTPEPDATADGRRRAGGAARPLRRRLRALRHHRARRRCSTRTP